MSLSEPVLKALDDMGYIHPTPVQRSVYEPMSKGKDLVVQARTGTGKTAAFGLPIANGLVRPDVAEVQAIVLCPTRELALQITRELDALVKYRGVKVTPVYGGAPMGRQIQSLRDGAQVLVGTPGRVLDHLGRETLNPTKVKAFVLDESDEMLSMGFLPQITEIWATLPKGHQTLLFSATLPADVQRIAETRLNDPEFITLSGDHIGALEIRHFVYLSHGDKVQNLIQVLEIENPESAIVFCNTRDETKKVAQALKQQGYSADWLNADLAQTEREKVMASTREGKLRYLVATDVAARGIDISHLTHVINHDFPESAESYVHRTGRTGRAGRTGEAISLITPGDIGHLYMLRLTYKIFPVEKSLPTARELKSREETDLVQMFVEATRGRKTHPDDLALARRLLTHAQAEVVVANLLRDHLGARPDAVEEATAARRAEQPKPSAASNGASQERKRERAPRRDRDDRPPRRDRDDRAPRRDGEERAARRDRDEQAPRRDGEERAARRDRDEQAPRRDGDERATREGDRKRKVKEKSPKRTSDADTVSRNETADTNADDAEIFVNVGRKDGAKPSDFQSLLEEQGFEAEDVHYVRVRNSHTFVGIPADLLKRALNALDGAQIAGQRAEAERARSRSN